LPYPGLLGADGGDQVGVGQRQAAAQPAGLVVVIDQDVLAVLVDAETVQVQASDLTDPPAGALEQLVGQYGDRAGPIAERAVSGESDSLKWPQ